MQASKRLAIQDAILETKDQVRAIMAALIHADGHGPWCDCCANHHLLVRTRRTTQVPAVTLNLDENNLAVLVRILEDRESVLKHIANMIHTTDAEWELLLHEAAVCQMTYLQLEGAGFKPAPHALDW